MSTGSSELRQVVAAPRPQYAQAVRLSLVIGVLILAPSWYMFEVYGRVLNSRNPATLAWLLLAAIGIYVVLELLELARSRALRQAGEQIARRLTPRVFDASFAAHLRKLPGGSPLPLSDVKTISDFVASPTVTGVLDLPSALVCLVLLFAMNFWVGMLAAASAVLHASLGFWQQQAGARPYGEANNASSEAQLRASGTLRNAQVVEALGMQPSMYRRWMKSQRRFIGRLSAASDSAGSIGALSKLLVQLQSSLLLGLACWMGLNGALAGGMAMVIVASILGGRALAPIAQVAGQWRQIGGVRVSWQRLNNMLSSIPKDEPGMALPSPQGMLSAEALFVTPPGGSAPVLKNVSFYARPGEMLTIFGPSAAGKSSLARAITGVWASQGGKVRLDGADIHAWHKSQLGPHVGYLPQGVELFDGSIAENIARFGRVDMALVRAAADQVGVTQTIEQLADGFDAQIGEDGTVLSGGQRQRIGLARAIYGSPRLLVLDEPNSSLDEAGERDLIALLQRLKQDQVTVIAITHRRGLLMAADRLLLLNDGAVARFGTRDEVLAAMQAALEQQAAGRAQAAQAAAARPPALQAPSAVQGAPA